MPRPVPCGSPRSAITGRIPRRQSRRRYLSWSYPRSASSASGRRRGLPTRPATAGILSSRGSSWVTSLRFPPVSDTASGMPWPSTMRWCLLPGRARSTGLGPLWGPVGPRERARSRSPPSTSPAGPSTAASPAAPRAADPRRRPRFRPPGAASRSSPSQSPAPAAGTPTGCRYAGRTESRTGPGGPALEVCPRPASAPARAATPR